MAYWRFLRSRFWGERPFYPRKGQTPHYERLKKAGREVSALRSARVTVTTREDVCTCGQHLRPMGGLAFGRFLVYLDILAQEQKERALNKQTLP
jgi:hypothetical protein